MEEVGGNDRSGDEAQIHANALFDRYEAQIHDFALALLRDRKVAVEVVRDTFRTASQRLEALEDVDRLFVWLLAITRFQAGLVAGETAGPDRRPLGPDDIPERAEQTGLVWEATADLPIRERAFLDLYLRQGLTGDDLAHGLGVRQSEVIDLHTALAVTEKGLAGYLLVNRSNGPCPDLPLVLRGWDGRFTALVCVHIAAHVESCRVCRASSADLASPLALYSSAARAPRPELPNRDEGSEASPSLVSAVDPSGPTRHWLPNGFPPRTFPQPGAQTAPVFLSWHPVPSSAPVRRPRLWPVAAVMLTVAVVAGALFLASRQDNNKPRQVTDSVTSLSTTTSSSVPPTPTSTTTATSLVEPIPTTIPGTSIPGTVMDSGVLALSTTALNLPKTDATAGASEAPLTLQNAGRGDLTFIAESTTPGLRVTPTRGTIAAGRSTNLTVSLEGAQLTTEGPFRGQLKLGGTGGTGTVDVDAIVGRPPDIVDNVGDACPEPSATCARAIKLAPTAEPGATACNTPWVYAVTISDQSTIRSARVIARRGLANADTALERASSDGLFVSMPFAPLPANFVLRFTVEATDEFGFTRRFPEQSITCP